MKKRKARKETPPQITLGGDLGRMVWRRYIVPMLKKGDLSTRELAEVMGVSAMTISRWRSAYL